MSIEHTARVIVAHMSGDDVAAAAAGAPTWRDVLAHWEHTHDIGELTIAVEQRARVVAERISRRGRTSRIEKLAELRRVAVLDRDPAVGVWVVSDDVYDWTRRPVFGLLGEQYAVGIDDVHLLTDRGLQLAGTERLSDDAADAVFSAMRHRLCAYLADAETSDDALQRAWALVRPVRAMAGGEL